jgi:hypothetical protein
MNHAQREGFVSVTPTSLPWKDRAVEFDIKLTQGVATSRVRQERQEKAGHRSPKWEVLRSLQQVYGARKVRDYTIIDTPPFLESVGREEREPLEKMVVMVWDGMTQEEQVIPQTVISGEKDWIIWRTKPIQSKQKRSENGSGGDFTRRKDWYRLNDIRKAA